jgi:hypothetical protein
MDLGHSEPKFHTFHVLYTIYLFRFFFCLNCSSYLIVIYIILIITMKSIGGYFLDKNPEPGLGRTVLYGLFQEP